MKMRQKEKIIKKKELLRELVGDEGRGIRAQLATFCEADPKTIYNWMLPVSDGGSWPKSKDEMKLWAFFDYELDERGDPIKKKEAGVIPAIQLTGPQLLELRRLVQH